MHFDNAGLKLVANDPISWAEFIGLHAEEVDVMTGSVTILQLEHESGHVIEIPELDEAYADVLLHLAKYLPLPDNWVSAVEGLEPRTSVTIWNRRVSCE